MGSLCTLSRKMVRIEWPDIRDRDTEETIRRYMAGQDVSVALPTNCLLCTHGAYGYAVFHVGVHVGNNTIVEFSKKAGMRAVGLDLFTKRCLEDDKKCNDPDGNGPTVRVYRPTGKYHPIAKEVSPFPFEHRDSVSDRAEWALRHVKKEDYHMFYKGPNGARS